MQELVHLLEDRNVITFLLLLVKISVIFAFFPYFNFTAFITAVKAPLVLLLAITFYPIAPLYSLDINFPTLVLAILAEGISGFIAGFFLKIVFDVIVYTAELISLTMGLSMAMVFDPLSQNQSTVIGQVFSLIAVVSFLSLDGDHLIIEFMYHSLANNYLGNFTFSSDIVNYILLQMKNFFVLGFTMAFPVLAVGLLGDVIFGMLMKTIPQFNLLVLGFPIKIALSVIVIISVTSSIVFLFKRNILEAYNHLQMFF